MIVKLQGGLGNQMFQYAAARALAVTKTVHLDLSFLNQNQTSTDSFTARSYQLGVFKDLNASNRYQWFIRLVTTKSSKLYFLKYLLPKRYQNVTVVHDDNFKIQPRADDITYLDGYFQNHKYFEPIRKQLLNEFKFPDIPLQIRSLAQKIRSSENPVSIHVRRGDYLRSRIGEFHGVLDVGYYKTATELIAKKIANPVFFIFSDDVDWCEQNLGFINNSVFVAQGHPGWIDMYLMTLCKHHVIANSSFSWWGAWLADHGAGQITVAPKRWFNNVDTSNALISSEWIKL